MVRSPLALLPLTAALACTTGGDDGDPFASGGPGSSTAAPSSSGTTGDTGGGTAASDTAGEGTDGDDSGSATSGVSFDVGPHSGGADGGNGQGCEKVDFLFVIDASPSMEAEQAQLIASFPGFIDSMKQTLTAQDYQIMVVDTDAHPQYTPVGGNGFCQDGSCCDSVCGQAPDENWCNNEPCADHSAECDFMLGAGKANDAGWDSCNLPGDRRWLSSDDPDLAANFACVAEVGTYGHFDETQGAAAVAAVSDGPQATCNGPFLRDDAVLVVTLISDEEDQSSAGEPQDWYDGLVAAKGGDASAVVMLGLVGDYGEAGSPCQPYDPEGTGAMNAQRLRDMVGLFGSRGLTGSVCATDYVPFFQQAVDLIDTACDEFVPPG